MLSRTRRCRFAMRMLDVRTAHIYCLRIIALRCLDRCAAEEELDLLQLAAREMA